MKPAPNRIGVLASGSGSNFEAIARACAAGVLAGAAEVVLLLTNRADAGALRRAAAWDVEAGVFPHGDFADRAAHELTLCRALRAARVDCVALAGYMRILTPVFLAELGVPVVNIHPVPTYWYQGAHGYEAAWAARATLPACFPTIHRVDAGVDTGAPVLFGLPYAVRELPDEAALRATGLAEEHAAYPLALRQLLRGDANDARIEWTAALRAWLAGNAERPAHAGLWAPERNGGNATGGPA